MSDLGITPRTKIVKPRRTHPITGEDWDIAPDEVYESDPPKDSWGLDPNRLTCDVFMGQRCFHGDKQWNLVCGFIPDHRNGHGQAHWLEVSHDA